LAVAAEFAHPVEGVLGNALPVMTGPLISKAGIAVLGLWCAGYCVDS
jgi:hypothetical protein